MRKFLVALLLTITPAFANGIAPVSPDQCAAMKAHHVMNAGAPFGCDRLNVVTFSYVDFEGRTHEDGKLVVLDALAPRVINIFETLKSRSFPIAKAKPIEAYNGDDNASMADDNTSSFNHRPIAGSEKLSLHAYGAAIDLNPVENPFLTVAGSTVSVAPPQGTAFLNRKEARSGKAPRKGFAEDVVQLFAENGFTQWGGDWDSPIDYQHFDIGRRLTEELVALPFDSAKARFEAVIAANALQTPKP